MRESAADEKRLVPGDTTAVAPTPLPLGLEMSAGPESPGSACADVPGSGVLGGIALGRRRRHMRGDGRGRDGFAWRLPCDCLACLLSTRPDRLGAHPMGYGTGWRS